MSIGDPFVGPQGRPGRSIDEGQRILLRVATVQSAEVSNGYKETISKTIDSNTAGT